MILPDETAVGPQPVKILQGTSREGAVRWDKVSSPVSVTIVPAVAATLQLPSRKDQPEHSLINVAIRVEPMVRHGNEAFVILNPLGGTLTQGYILPGTLSSAMPHHLIAEGEIAPGRYLVRVQIDGVISRPWLDENPESPSYRQMVGPSMEIR